VGGGIFEQELNRYWKTMMDPILNGVLIVGKAGIIVFVDKALETV